MVLKVIPDKPQVPGYTQLKATELYMTKVNSIWTICSGSWLGSLQLGLRILIYKSKIKKATSEECYGRCIYGSICIVLEATFRKVLLTMWWIDWQFLYVMLAALAIFTARIVLCFYSDSTFIQYVKTHNQFLSIDTYKIKILDISTIWEWSFLERRYYYVTETSSSISQMALLKRLLH